jgi:hypothetical protein
MQAPQQALDAGLCGRLWEISAGLTRLDSASQTVRGDGA